MLFTRRHENSNYKTIDPFFYYYLFISHAQTITIHYIYNSLQVTVIVYRKEKKKKNKVHKNTIVYILTITRRLPILLRFYFHDVLEPAENYISYKFRFKRIVGFVIEYAWFSKIITYIIQ